MKHVIEFELPEDQYELDCAILGGKLVRAVVEYQEWLRDRMKHHGESALEPAQKALFEIMEESEVILPL